MGTNYYARIIPTKKRRDELCNLIQTSNDFNEITSQIEKTFGSFFRDYDLGYDTDKPFSGGVIHLGKKSYGWMFLWNPNIYEIRQGHMEYEDPDTKLHGKFVPDPSTAYKVYELNKKSIKEFLNQDNIAIYDEYGQLIDKKVFFITSMKHKKSDVDAKGYYESLAKKGIKEKIYSCMDEYVEFLQSQGYKIEYPYHDFMSDGLRFATSTDFC